MTAAYTALLFLGLRAARRWWETGDSLDAADAIVLLPGAAMTAALVLASS